MVTSAQRQTHVKCSWVSRVHRDKAGRLCKIHVFSGRKSLLSSIFTCATLSWPHTCPAPIHATQCPSPPATSQSPPCRACVPGSLPAISALITRYSSLSQTQHFYQLVLISFLPNLSQHMFCCFLI